MRRPTSAPRRASMSSPSRRAHRPRSPRGAARAAPWRGSPRRRTARASSRPASAPSPAPGAPSPLRPSSARRHRPRSPAERRPAAAPRVPRRRAAGVAWGPASVSTEVPTGSASATARRRTRRSATAPWSSPWIRYAGPRFDTCPSLRRPCDGTLDPVPRVALPRARPDRPWSRAREGPPLPSPGQ